MSELVVLRRPRPPAIVPPLLSFTAGFIDSFTVLALFGLFVAQVTGSNLARFSCAFRPLPAIACVSENHNRIASFAFRLFPGVSGRILISCLPDADP
ncbi:MAG TPA: hypothetical protein VFV12_07690 [Xanthobacteraceae bacterium]|nr:hypothetical protein [Xanthobacteraceae bacterium]